MLLKCHRPILKLASEDHGRRTHGRPGKVLLQLEFTYSYDQRLRILMKLLIKQTKLAVAETATLMIHVFNGCKEVCSLPAKACTACGDLCDCEDCCSEICGSCTACVHRPLGTYVVCAILLSLAEIGFCLAALLEDDLGSCTFPDGMAKSVGVGSWLRVQMGCAWLNLIFAPYIQYQLMQTLQAKAGVGEMDQRAIKDSFQEVFLHDIGVCLYVFAWIGSLVWSIFGFSWLRQAPAACDPQGWVSVAALLGIAFFWCLLCYGFVWYCYISCTSHRPVNWAMKLIPTVTGKAHAHAAHAAAASRTPGVVPGPASVPPSGCGKACTVTQLAKLVACVGLDLFGDATYFFPVIGEGVDLAYAPIQGIALMMLFGSRSIATVGFLEELLPFTDLIPSATLGWILETFFAESCLGRALGFSQHQDGGSSSSDE
ncbi:unnamed protein product [Symbiodinium sp. CCMP2592]|nr:unnamed protein product [Symbiodinium sp. CCMP2592]